MSLDDTTAPEQPMAELVARQLKTWLTEADAKIDRLHVLLQQRPAAGSVATRDVLSAARNIWAERRHACDVLLSGRPFGVIFGGEEF